MTKALTRTFCGLCKFNNPGHGVSRKPLDRGKVLTLGALLLALAACSNVKKIEPDRLTSIESTRQLSPLWTAKLGDGSKRSVVQFSPYVSETSVFGVSAEGKVQAFDRTSGAQIWEIDLSTELTAGISGDDRYLYAGSSNGDVYSIDPVSYTHLTLPTILLV